MIFLSETESIDAYSLHSHRFEFQALFERLENQSGIMDANYFLLQAALLEERINDAVQIAEQGLESARKSAGKLDEVKMLRGHILVKLAEGKPLDALELASKAEALLMTLEKNHKEAGEILLLVAQAHMLQGTTSGQHLALNAALQAVDHFAKVEDGRGEADSWRVVGDARVALGKYEDGLRAIEAAMVISVDGGDEVGQALCLLSLSKAHMLRGLPPKAKKASEKALNLFHEQDSDLLAAQALEILVQALIGQEQRKDALQRAKQELQSFLGSGDKWAVPRMRGRGGKIQSCFLLMIVHQSCSLKFRNLAWSVRQPTVEQESTSSSHGLQALIGVDA